MRTNLLTLGLVTTVIGLGAFARPETRTVEAAPAPAQPAVAAAPAAAPAPVAAPNPRETFVRSALDAFSSQVGALSSDDALATAFTAYYNFKAAHPDQVRKPYLYFVDYGLSNTTPRGFIFDMEQMRLIEGPFIVAHGRGSSAGKYGVPTRFSNRSGAATTSLGLYVTQESYEFSGHAGGQLYHSIGLRLDGKSGQFNDAARARGVVMHGAPYVTPSGSGRSEGCPAVEQARARRLIPMIENGSVVFLYSPNDATWVQQDPWAHAE